MARDLLGDNLATLRIVENEEDESPLDETEKFHTGFKTRSFRLSTNPFLRSDPICYYNHCVNDEPTIQYKTLSLPINSFLHQCDEETVNCAIRIAPDIIANQLTLLDLKCFRAIQPEELTSCGWTKQHKLTVAPNIVAFTKRFNQVIFWTVQEILNGPTPKARAEIITHFIRVAKKLQELNSLHSLYAVISALKSASIYRLEKTWSCLPKKDKHCFEKISEIFVEQNNFEALREYLNKVQLPCIPYLGLFLTDLVFIDIVHPQGRSQHRDPKMAVVLESLAKFQNSEYHLKPLEHVAKYLNSVRYIEELQKFLEDDQYKLSLKLEPITPESSTSSKESVCKDQAVSPSRRNSSSLRLPSHSGFLPTHRKCRSLGSNVFYKNNMEDAVDTSTLTSSVNLLDDTVLETPLQAKGDAPPNAYNNWVDILPSEKTYQGCVRRKTLMKDGRKPSVSCWQRYWMQLCGTSLLYFQARSFRGCTRDDFKMEPCKMNSLQDWVVVNSPSDAPDSFRLINNTTACLYKFKAESEISAKLWVIKIRALANKSMEPLPANLMSFE